MHFENRWAGLKNFSPRACCRGVLMPTELGNLLLVPVNRFVQGAGIYFLILGPCMPPHLITGFAVTLF